MIIVIPALVFYFSKTRTSDNALENAVMTLFLLTIVMGAPLILIISKQLYLKWPEPKHKNKTREKLRTAKAWLQAISTSLVLWFLFLLFTTFTEDVDANKSISWDNVLTILYLTFFFTMISGLFIKRWGWHLKISLARIRLRMKRNFRKFI
jgi:nicotinamide riboside transporter PnuC